MDQYKNDLKASTKARTDLNVLRMLESRIIEIVQIENEVKRKYPKLFSQRLPRYMRRRAASHNPHRIPKWLRTTTKLSARDRSKLYHLRHKMRLKKHKRIVKRHRGHKYKNPNKPIFHKWFAKRFKMIKDQTEMEHVPLHNNTKNFRNLYRQTRYGCAYLSLAHLVEIRVCAPYTTVTINKLNTLTKSTAGFTFAARSLELGHYEVLAHLYSQETVITEGDGEKTTTTTDKTTFQQTYLCPAFVSHPSSELFSLWVGRDKRQQVVTLLKATKLTIEEVEPRSATRVRLVGPEARKEAMRIALDKNIHETAILDVDRRLPATRKFGLTIGRYVKEKDACFTYYQTNPHSVDIVFRHHKAGRHLWYNLIKNKAHLVGGKRDVDSLLKDKQCFSLKPDC